MDLQLLPPGLKGQFTEKISYGNEEIWAEITQTRLYTNAYIVKDGKVLLGYKKRGIGEGFYNGFGGKVEPGETVQQAAIRELEEEAGITSPLEHAGVLLFTTDTVEWAFHIDIYRATEFTGSITETEEMRPEWFDITDLPSNMWETDKEWMPLLLMATPFIARADFRTVEGKSRPVKWWIGT